MASHAYITTSLLRPAPGDRWGLLPTGSERQLGPVTVALKAMHAADPDRRRLAKLRRAIADRIEADVGLLDALDGDADFELDAGEEPEGHDDREPDDSGIGDADGVAEQFAGTRYVLGGAA